MTTLPGPPPRKELFTSGCYSCGRTPGGTGMARRARPAETQTDAAATPAPDGRTAPAHVAADIAPKSFAPAKEPGTDKPEANPITREDQALGSEMAARASLRLLPQGPVGDGNPDGASFAELALRHCGDGVVVTDADRRTLWVNAAFTTLTGYTLEHLRDQDPGTVLQGPDTDPATIRAIREAKAQRRELQCDILNYNRAGDPYWVELHIVPVHDLMGRHTHFVSTLREITARKELEDQNESMRQTESMRQAERQLLAQTSEWLYSARSSDELMMVVQRAMHTLIPEADGALYVYANSRDTLDLAARWGTAPEAFAARIAPEDCWALRRGRAYSYGLKAIEFACDHVHGDVAPPFFCLPIIAHGETIGLLHLRFDGFEEGGLLRHMREQVLRHRWDLGLICAEQINLAIANVRLRQELEDQSVRDPLTGLWNRRWFLDAAHRELARARDTGRPLSLISLDVDHFKRFNDHHGHDAGDTVLREVGALMRTHFHGDCRPCRLGGEEFVILCVNTPCDAALELAHGFAQVLKDVRIAYDGQMLPPITVSGGISSHPGHADSVLRLLKIADTALYAAKEAGRDRILIAEAVTGSSPGHSTKQTEAERNRPPPPQRAQGAKC